MTWTKLLDLCGKDTANPFISGAIIKQSLAHPEEVVSVDDRGYTPLHVAVAGGNPSQEVIKALLEANNNVVRKKDINGSTPLHIALWPEINANIIRLLIDACPEAASEKDKEGLMAIHVACRYCPCNEEVIRILIDANPSGLYSRTRMGNLVQKKNGVSPSLSPIEVVPHNQHIVLDGITSPAWKDSQIKSIAQSRYEERSQQIRDGSYPLHMAIKSGAPRHVLEMLSKEAPEVASKTDKFGRSCLHLALIYSENIAGDVGADFILETVKLVHSFNLAQVQTKDKEHRLPVHTACEVGCSIDIVKFLVDTYPDSVYTKTSDGKSALEVAIASGRCSKEVIDYLTKFDATEDVEVPQ